MRLDTAVSQYGQSKHLLLAPAIERGLSYIEVTGPTAIAVYPPVQSKIGLT